MNKWDHPLSIGLVAGLTLLMMPGCGAFGLRKQLQQLEHENQRLLSEFRAERQRREQAERTAQQLELRLAESEKLLARQLQEGSPGRLSSLPFPAPGGAPSPSQELMNGGFLGGMRQQSSPSQAASQSHQWQPRGN